MPSTSVPAATGIIQGIVKHEAYFASRIPIPEGPLAGAVVTITEGPGSGQNVTTAADGAYRFELPPGPYRVRWTATAYEPRDSDAGSVVPGQKTTLAPVTLRLLSNVPIAEWSVSGVVRDGRGNPVAAASVAAGWVGPFPVAGASTDANGRFRIVSTRQHPDPMSISASKAGYVSQSVTAACGPSCAVTTDFRLLRIIREWLDAPSTMQVGDIARVATVNDYDDGTRAVYNAFVHSSNSAVVAALPTQPPDYKTYIKAIGEGTATLQVAASQTLIINVRVIQ